MWRIHVSKIQRERDFKKKGYFSSLSRLIKRAELVNISRAGFIIEDESNEDTRAIWIMEECE